MVLCVLWGSWIPVVIKLLDDGTSPFLVLACWRVGSACFCAAGLGALALWVGPEVLRGLWRRRRRFVCLPVLFMLLNSTEYSFFLLACRFIDPAVATVVLEAHFLFGILLLLAVSRGRYADSLVALVALLPLCLGGMVFLAAAEYGGFGAMASGLGRGVLGPLVGGGLALVGSLAIAGAFLVFRWAEEMGRSLALERGSLAGSERLGVVALAAAALVGNLGSVPVLTGVGLVSGASLPGGGAALTWVGMGFLVLGPPVLFWRLSVYLSRYVGITALGGLAPVGTLGLFWMFSMVAVPRPDYLVAGMVLVVGAGGLLQAQGAVGTVARRVSTLVRG